jgi:anti-sigma factor RsiW
MDEETRLTDERFVDYVDGAMDDAARARFEAELDADPTLASDLAAYRETVSALAGLEAVHLEEDTFPALRRRLRRHAVARRAATPGRQEFMLELLIGLALVALISLVSLVGPSPSDAPTEPCTAARLAASLTEADVAVRVATEEGGAVGVLYTESPATLKRLEARLDALHCPVTSREAPRPGHTVLRVRFTSGR